MSSPAASRAALLLFLLATARLAAAGETLAGQVVPPAAAAKARVELWPGCPPARSEVPQAAARPLASVRPGPDGRFRIAAPLGEPLLLRVAAEGFVPAEHWIAPGMADLPTLRLKRAERLELALAGPDGGPLAGLPLYFAPAAPAADRNGWTTPEDRVVSGPDGRATLDRRPGEALTLVVASPGLIGRYQLAAGSPQRLVLAPGRPVTLTAADPAGRPVPGARVRLLGAQEVDELGRTGPDGRLEMRLPSGAAKLTLTVEDQSRQQGRQAEVVLGLGAERSLTATLRPARAVAGRVIDAATRLPVAGARVEASCRAATRSAADGSFRLGLGPRETEVEAWAPGYLVSNLSLRDPGALGPFTLALQPAVELALRVVDEAGAPVAGARIQAVPTASGTGQGGPGMPGLAATSGPDGTARLATRAGTLYELTAERDGFAPGSKRVRPPAGPTAGPTILVLTRGVTLIGRLASEEGEPIPGGEVSIQPEPGASARQDEPRRAAAGPDGRFALGALAPGRHRLTARAPGRAPAAELPVEIPAGVRQADLGTLALAVGAVLEGRVVDDRDRPIAGAQVVLVGGPGRQTPAVSGADGGFRLPELERGQAELWVVREGYVQATFSGLAVPAAEPHVLRLRPARGISGQVVGPHAEPVAGAVVHRLRSPEGNPERFTGSSSLAHGDPEGRFAAGGLEPGPLPLMVEAPGYRTRQLQVEVPEDRDAGPLEIALEAGAVVEGRVLAAGRPLAAARVQAYPTEPAGPHAGSRATTDGDGRYRLAGLATGGHEITVADDDGHLAGGQLEVRPGRQQLDFDLPGGELTGRAVDAAGAPVGQASLRLAGPEDRFTSSAADGSFAFRSLPPGSYRLEAHHQEAGRAELPEVAVAERPIALPDLVLGHGPETAAVAGRLLGLALRDLAQATVRARFLPQASDEQVVDQPSAVDARVSADGAFRLAGLLPGTWRIRAEAGARRPVEQEVRLAAGEQATLDLELHPGTRLTGRLTVDGQPVAGRQIQLVPDGGDTRTGDDGAFTLPDLRAGAYTLVVDLEMLGTWKQAVEISSDRESEVQEIDVQVVTGTVAGRAVSPRGPVAGARVDAVRLLAPPGVITFQTGAYGPQTATDVDGAFRFGLLPGRYSLRLQAGGSASVQDEIRTEVEVTAGEEVRVEMAVP
jgi:Carboxypeptidase regulatory-like domain